MWDIIKIYFEVWNEGDILDKICQFTITIFILGLIFFLLLITIYGSGLIYFTCLCIVLYGMWKLLNFIASGIDN